MVRPTLPLNGGPACGVLAVAVAEAVPAGAVVGSISARGGATSFVSSATSAEARVSTGRRSMRLLYR
jgi:hypothetical protein